jgi:16S rRNA (cytosine1402-N4)-methyltransferase
MGLGEAGAMGGYVHRSVLLKEVVAALAPRPGGDYFDATLGGGGHAEAILEASSPSGWLYGLDRDEVAVAAAGERLARFAGRFELRQGSFAEMGTGLRPAVATGCCSILG